MELCPDWRAILSIYSYASYPFSLQGFQSLSRPNEIIAFASFAFGRIGVPFFLFMIGFLMLDQCNWERHHLEYERRLISLSGSLIPILVRHARVLIKQLGAKVLFKRGNDSLKAVAQIVVGDDIYNARVVTPDQIEIIGLPFCES